jgi:hypoxia up-regulated 1
LADHRALAKLWNEANKVKYVLSANTETQSSVESVIDDIDFKAPVTRDEFEQLTKIFDPRVSQPVLDALTKQLNTSNAPVDIKKVDSIILTGGSVRFHLFNRN